MYSIKRNIEKIVEKRAKNNKAILLTGPRQVGKSTLFKHLFKNVNQVTFDDDLLLAQAEEDIGLFLLNNPTPLVINEVQKCFIAIIAELRWKRAQNSASSVFPVLMNPA